MSRGCFLVSPGRCFQHKGQGLGSVQISGSKIGVEAGPGLVQHHAARQSSSSCPALLAVQFVPTRDNLCQVPEEADFSLLRHAICSPSSGVARAKLVQGWFLQFPAVKV